MGSHATSKIPTKRKGASSPLITAVQKRALTGLTWAKSSPIPITVDKMMMWLPEAPRLEFIDHHKWSLSRVTVKDGVVVRTLVGRVAPLELIRCLKGDSLRIEFDG